MTDAGLAVGAALVPCIRDRADAVPWPRTVLPDVYLGAEFSDAEIQRELNSHGLEYTRADDTETAIGELLADGYVVARFNGRMEYGPRALGNRSILYQPSDRSVNHWLNSGWAARSSCPSRRPLWMSMPRACTGTSQAPATPPSS